MTNISFSIFNSFDVDDNVDDSCFFILIDEMSSSFDFLINRIDLFVLKRLIICE